MNEYQITYDTIKILFDKISEKKLNVYLIGGISAAIQAGVDLYRKNEDLDVMIDINDLPDFIQILKENNYIVEDKRKTLTRNKVDLEGNFHALDHELNANTDAKKLGVGIFTYEINGEKVITRSYAYNEEDGMCEEYIKELPKRLFDLMYDNKEKEYHGVNVRCQTRSYIYLKKSEGIREKDKQDASIIEKHITLDDKKEIEEIKRLEKNVVSYLVRYDKNGEEISKVKFPSFEEKLEIYIKSVIEKNKEKSSIEIKQMILEDNEIKKIIEKDDIIKEIIERWKNLNSTKDMAADARKIAHDYLERK